MRNDVEKKQMVCGDNTRFNALCDIQHLVEQPNVKWNSPWHHHDIENLKCGAKAACLQPGFHLTFVHFGKFASADFMLILITA